MNTWSFIPIKSTRPSDKEITVLFILLQLTCLLSEGLIGKFEVRKLKIHSKFPRFQSFVYFIRKKPT